MSKSLTLQTDLVTDLATGDHADVSIADKVCRWALTCGRHDLPWQKKPTSYAVWVSEIMLQQTQVMTVIAYYQRFMRRFPSLRSLAVSRIDDVLGLWSGLGYYRRAHFMHQAAKMIQLQFNGRFPRTRQSLEQLPGIGRSTAGAILSLGQRQYGVILDGNVKRVLGRCFAMEEPFPSAVAYRTYWDIATRQTPTVESKIYNQGMMDLGATICTPKKPSCGQCPLKTCCRARKAQCQMMYPRKKQPLSVKARRKRQVRLLLMVRNSANKRRGIKDWRTLNDMLSVLSVKKLAEKNPATKNPTTKNPAMKKPTEKKRANNLCRDIEKAQKMLFANAAFNQFAAEDLCSLELTVQLLIRGLLHKAEWMLEKRADYGIWSGLYCFPMISSSEDVSEYMLEQYHFKVRKIITLPEKKHVFSHFDLYAEPTICLGHSVQDKVEEPGHMWCDRITEHFAGGMPSLMTKLIKEYGL